jgi:ABC-type siderophore export system fused ATPase/permease subunit
MFGKLTGKHLKTSMLTGLLKPSAGAASVDGLDIETEMQAIYLKMGNAVYKQIILVK